MIKQNPKTSGQIESVSISRKAILFELITCKWRILVVVSATQTNNIDSKIKTEVSIANGSLQYRKIINCSFVSEEFLVSQVCNGQYEDDKLPCAPAYKN